MYVRKADVGVYGRTLGCRSCRDVILEKTHCAPQRSDIIFAEAKEKKQKTENEREELIPAVEAPLTGGSSGSEGPSTVPPAAMTSRKRRADVEIADIDASAGDAAASPSVITESTGTKRQADTSVRDIDPQSGDGADVAALVTPPRRRLAMCSPPRK